MGLPVPPRVQQMRELAEAGDFEGLRSFADTAVQAAASSGALELPGQGIEQGWTNIVDGSDDRKYGISKANPSAGFQPIPVAGDGVTFSGGEESRRVQSSQILPDGTQIVVFTDGSSQVTRADGKVLQGQAAADAIKQAQQFGAEIQGLRSGERAAGDQAIKLSGEAYEKLQSVGNSTRLLNSALEALDNGARTGQIYGRLPSVSQASQALDQVQRELGLNVLQNTTFGALSKDELRFALDTGLPAKSMGEEELRRWIDRKLRGQSEVEDYLYRAATFLGRPGNTVADWLEMNRAMQKDRQDEAPGDDVGRPPGQIRILSVQ
jgi:hypothetical protein